MVITFNSRIHLNSITAGLYNFNVQVVSTLFEDTYYSLIYYNQFSRIRKQVHKVIKILEN